MITLQDAITVIVRESGERTADACVSLLEEAFNGAVIHRVSGAPFHVTLRRALELGIAQGKTWTLCIDADVLVLPDLHRFLAEAVELSPNVFEAQGLVRDKLIPSRRPAGNHLYRTELLPLALPDIPTRGSLRPESDMIHAMVEKGYPFHQSRHVVGLHDFGQSLLDVYGKAFLHGRKHQYLSHLFAPIWHELSTSDADYRIAVAALEDALVDTGELDVARGEREQAAMKALARLNLVEKTPVGGAGKQLLANMLEDGNDNLSQAAVLSMAEIQRSIDDAMNAIALQCSASTQPRRSLMGKVSRLCRRLFAVTMRTE